MIYKKVYLRKGLSAMGKAFISYGSRNLEDILAIRSALMHKGVRNWKALGNIPVRSTYAGLITRTILREYI